MFEIAVPEYRSIDIMELLSGETRESGEERTNSPAISLLSVLQYSGTPSRRRFLSGIISRLFMS